MKPLWPSVIFSVVFALVVIWAFSRLEGRFETIVVAILGIIYTAIIESNLNAQRAAKEVHRMLLAFHLRVSEEFEWRDDDLKEDMRKELKNLNRTPENLSIHLVPLAILLICLYHLFGALMAGAK